MGAGTATVMMGAEFSFAILNGVPRQHALAGMWKWRGSCLHLTLLFRSYWHVSSRLREVWLKDRLIFALVDVRDELFDDSGLILRQVDLALFSLLQDHISASMFQNEIMPLSE